MSSTSDAPLSVAVRTDTGKVRPNNEDAWGTRWLDQGASRARVIAVTENRYEAGLIEVALKQHFSDKTD